MEIWRDIIGYEGLYQVSNCGRVKSLERTFFSGKDGKIKQTYPERYLKNRYANGYVYVGLSKDGHVRKFKVHRLVAMAFIQNENAKPCIDHINGIRDDNRAENLRWVDAFENMNNLHTLKNISDSKMGDKNPMKKMKRPVLQIDAETGNIIAEFEGVNEAASVLGFDRANISRCCNLKREKHKGYVWRYK